MMWLLPKEDDCCGFLNCRVKKGKRNTARKIVSGRQEFKILDKKPYIFHFSDFSTIRQAFRLVNLDFYRSRQSWKKQITFNGSKAMYHKELAIPKPEIQQRINLLKKQLETNKLKAALILQRADLYYFSGTIQQAHLYIPTDDEPILMVHKSSERAAAESALDRIISITSPKQIPEWLLKNGYQLPERLGLELDVLPTNLYFQYRQIFANTKITDVSHLIRLVRSVKSTYELDLIRQAAQLSDQVAAHVPELLVEGMTELELAGQVEAEARKLGHQGIVRMRLWGSELFYGHLMSGPSAAVPSYLASPTGGSGVSPAVAQGPSFRRIKRNEPILVDYVFAHNGYLADHSRIFSIGTLPDKFMQAHEAMLAVQQTIKKEARPGIASGVIYDMARECAKQLGYDDNFMGVGTERIRFVGHGIGLELDEYPFLAAGQQMKLTQGMTLALEPKVIFPGQGVVGIENTHLVTEHGLEQLTHYQEEIVVI